MENLTDFTNVLDEKLGIIGGRVETLHDIQVLLGQLVEKMDTAFKNGEQFQYIAHHRELKMLKELMFYTVDELEDEYQVAYKTHEKMFHEITQKSPIAVNE